MKLLSHGLRLLALNHCLAVVPRVLDVVVGDLKACSLFKIMLLIMIIALYRSSKFIISLQIWFA